MNPAQGAGRDLREATRGGDDPVWVVIAAFNEGSQVGDVVSRVVGTFPNVVVVDDGSSDGTGAVALRAGATVITHPINLGQGAALRTGMDHALRQGAEFIVTFDADGQHRVEDALEMVERLRASDAEVALGSRFLGHTENMPESRRLLLKCATLFTRLTAGLDVTDAHNGLRAFRSSAARTIPIRQNRMAHASEILEEIGRQGLKYIEVPIVIAYTDYSMAKGQSGFGAFNILLDLLMARLRK